MSPRDLDRHDANAPIFDRAAFRLTDDQADLIEKTRRFGLRVAAPRAAFTPEDRRGYNNP